MDFKQHSMDFMMSNKQEQETEEKTKDNNIFDEKLVDLIKQNTDIGNFEIYNIIRSQNLRTAVNEEGNTLLHFASIYHNIDLIQDLIDSGFDVNVQNGEGKTPLILALESEFLRFDVWKIPGIEILCSAKANIYIEDNSGNSAARVVFGSKTYINETIVELFFNMIKQDCLNNYEVLVEKLRNLECSLRMIVVLQDCNLVERMIQNCLSNNICNENFFENSLHLAVGMMDLEMVRILLKYGADANAKSERGWIPMGYYAYDIYCSSVVQHPEIVELLVDKFVFPNDIDNKESFLASQTRNIFQSGNKKTIEALLRFNSEILLFKDDEGRAVMHYLVQNFHSDITEVLKNQKYDVNLCDFDNNTPLHYASKNCDGVHINTFRFLLNNAADVNAINDDEIVPLFLLCKNNSSSEKTYCRIIKLFLQYGLDAQYCGPNDLSVFDIIEKSQSFSTAKPILAHLAILEEQGNLTEHIRNKISSHKMFENYFSLCKRKLQKTKNYTISKDLTIYSFLIDPEDIIIRRYRFNHTVLCKLKKLLIRFHINYHYYGIVQKRISNIAMKIESIQKSAQVICKLLKTLYDPNHLAVSQIFSHLCYSDLQALGELA